jgi:hypothetical protein
MRKLSVYLFIITTLLVGCYNTHIGQKVKPLEMERNSITGVYHIVNPTNVIAVRPIRAGTKGAALLMVPPPAQLRKIPTQTNAPVVQQITPKQKKDRLTHYILYYLMVFNLIDVYLVWKYRKKLLAFLPLVVSPSVSGSKSSSPAS